LRLTTCLKLRNFVDGEQRITAWRRAIMHRVIVVNWDAEQPALSKWHHNYLWAYQKCFLSFCLLWTKAILGPDDKSRIIWGIHKLSHF
jgi:hypothetical protein